ncbi:uncharacterized protein BBA_10172 [Beauveria bassiana ARSEF 2860]|uniref:Uncharacterized protein n=1 Tax=Beauveria bassiana (strain ARSEF 2860) TaxID=655819 RepID=J4UEW8_BEAB2|nr:uncharacterized protein BBA_10172 [Beauveria bassiana ARSEF 2860]EJP60872.1 hypothetical protein BBA_10172 [Beauveria bassiana ARSEF 2860]
MGAIRRPGGWVIDRGGRSELVHGDGRGRTEGAMIGREDSSEAGMIWCDDRTGIDNENRGKRKAKGEKRGLINGRRNAKRRQSGGGVECGRVLSPCRFESVMEEKGKVWWIEGGGEAGRVETTWQAWELVQAVSRWWWMDDWQRRQTAQNQCGGMIRKAKQNKPKGGRDRRESEAKARPHQQLPTRQTFKWRPISGFSRCITSLDSIPNGTEET